VIIPPLSHFKAIEEYVRRASHCGTNLRPVGSSDAEFIVSLRTNEKLNRHISSTSGNIPEQERWIEDYLGRFKRGEEAYFVVEHNGHRWGTIRIYNYDVQAGTFVYGSWLVSTGAPACCAFSSTILNHDLGFSVLGFSKVLFDVRKENRSVCRFHDALGAAFVREDEVNRHYEITSKAYPAVRAKLEKFAQRFHEHPIP